MWLKLLVVPLAASRRPSALFQDMCPPSASTAADVLPKEIGELWRHCVGKFTADLETPTKTSTAGPSDEEQLKEDMGSAVPKGAYEKALQDSWKEGGNFETRGSKLAYEFDKARKQDKKLQNDYACVAGREAKAAFRSKWVSDQWSGICRKRMETHTMSNSSSCVADFRPIKKWVDDLGSNQEALDGVAFFLRKVLATKPEERVKYMKRSE